MFMILNDIFFLMLADKHFHNFNSFVINNKKFIGFLFDVIADF